MNDPINILILEHKLIHRFIYLLERKLLEMKKTQEFDPIFIDHLADFFEDFVNRHHHLKEEHIFFKQLETKKLTDEHKQLLIRLENEHHMADRLVAKIVEAKHEFVNGFKNSFDDIISYLQHFIDLYTPHIEIENDHFFADGIKYFNQNEIINLFMEFEETNPEQALEKYTIILEKLEKE